MLVSDGRKKIQKRKPSDDFDELDDFDNELDANEKSYDKIFFGEASTSLHASTTEIDRTGILRLAFLCPSVLTIIADSYRDGPLS